MSAYDRHDKYIAAAVGCDCRDESVESRVRGHITQYGQQTRGRFAGIETSHNNGNVDMISDVGGDTLALGVYIIRTPRWLEDTGDGNHRRHLDEKTPVVEFGDIGALDFRHTRQTTLEIVDVERTADDAVDARSQASALARDVGRRDKTGVQTVGDDNIKTPVKI